MSIGIRLLLSLFCHTNIIHSDEEEEDEPEAEPKNEPEEDTDQPKDPAVKDEPQEDSGRLRRPQAEKLELEVYSDEALAAQDISEIKADVATLEGTQCNHAGSLKDILSNFFA